MIDAPESTDVLFHEIQRSRWAKVAAAVAVILVLVNLPALLTGRALDPLAFVHLVVLLGACISAASRLRTVVDRSTLEVDRRWSGRLKIDLREVRSVRAASYYHHIDGGCGVRSGRGVIVTTDDGHVQYIGSARADELCEVIRSCLGAPSPQVPSPGRSAAPAPSA